MPHAVAHRADPLSAYLAWARALSLDEIQRFVPADDALGPVLYDLVLDYPRRAAKGIRPALCLATCGALGGATDDAVRSAAALELFHNAVLIHDDIEDGSELRRGAPTLHRTQGIPVAINVGDAMLALALTPLLDNTRVLDLGRALAILKEVAEMARVTAEGQAIELDWIRRGEWDLSDADYVGMVGRKTARYTFVTPTRVGALIAGASTAQHEALHGFSQALGVAFQVTDDVLNLCPDEGSYGKERYGDLWEGKRTSILLHALRTAPPHTRARALEALSRARPGSGERAPRTVEDVDFLVALINRTGSLDHARAQARHHALRADAWLAQLEATRPPSPHLAFLRSLLDYVHQRRQ